MAEWIRHFRWNAEGVTPENTDLPTKGFAEGYKPPAPLFNYFFNQNMQIIDQLQNEVDTKANADHIHNMSDMDDYSQEIGAIYNSIADNYNELNQNKADVNHLHYASNITRTNDNNKTIEETLSELENKVDKVGESVPTVTATSSDGIAYTATVNGVTSLKTGLTIIIVPNRGSTSTALTLNINGLGAKNIKMSVGGSTTGSVVNVPSNNFLTPNKPLLIQYDGVQWKSLLQVASATNLQGVVPIEKGGTGATTVEELIGVLTSTSDGYSIAKISTYNSYIGTGLDNGTSTVILNFDFPIKYLFIGKRTLVNNSTRTEYQYENSPPINIDTLLLNDYNGKVIATKVQLNPENTTPSEIVVSADKKSITITATNAHVGMNNEGGYYYYTAIG